MKEINKNKDLILSLLFYIDRRIFKKNIQFYICGEGK
jgi:hypothetical protein